MPLPVAHGLFGSTVLHLFGRGKPTGSKTSELLLGALLGIAPDFDYLLNYIPGLGGGWHHGFTHSIVFACMVGSLISLGAFKPSWRVAMAYSLAIISHPLLDYFFTESRGIELLWPLSARRFKLMIPNPIDYTWSNSSLSAAVLDLLRIGSAELIIFGPLLLVVLWVRMQKPVIHGTRN
jgi:membrane-bound metal-dependent hydrolase YbcI (DUF457 family)